MLDEDKALVTSNLESMLTLYCKSRSISYDRDAGWPSILRVLVSLKYSKAELYNCFYAIATKYIPRFVARISSVCRYVVVNDKCNPIFPLFVRLYGPELSPVSKQTSCKCY